MTREQHMEHIYAAASTRLYYLKQLGRCDVGLDDQLMWYKAVIGPIIKYTCPAWHTSLMTHDTETLGNIQKRAMSVIFPGINYHEILKTSILPSSNIIYT